MIMYRKLLFSFWAAVLVGMLSFESAAQTFNTPTVTTTGGAVSASGYCVGGQINVAFTPTGFAAGTSYSVQLSDAAGVFPTTPNAIGSGTASPITATLAPATLVSGTSYKVRVVAGAVNSAASAVFQVTNTPAPTVTTSTYSYCQNAAATPITATGTGILWYNAATAGSSLGGPTYTPPTTTIGSTTVYAEQTVSGCPSQTRTPVSITITAAPPAPVVTPASYAYCQNATATTITGTGFKWYAAATGGAALNGGSASYTPSTNTSGTITVYAEQTVGTCVSASRTPVSITVNPTPVVSAVANAAYCNGAAGLAIVFNSITAGTSYSWTSNANVGFGTAGVGSIPAFTAANATSAPIVATVTVTPSAGTCPGAAITFTVTVNPTPTVNAIANATYCGGAAGAAINFSGSVAGTTYNWTSNVNVGFGTAASGNIPAFTAINATAAAVVATVTVTPISGACSGQARTFTVTSNPAPTVAAVGNLTYCNVATGAPINFTTPVTGTNISWTSSINVGFGTTGTGNIAAFPATNATSAPITTTVTVTPTAGACPGVPITFTVTVNPTPTVAAIGNITSCGNVALAAIPFSSSVSGTTFSWTSSANAGFGTVGTGSSIPAYTSINTPTAVTTATVSITPTANGCTGAAGTFTVTINPTPVITPVINAILCNNTAGAAIAFASTTPSTSYAWTSSSNVGFGLSGTGNIPAYTGANLTAIPVVSTINVTPNTATCSGVTSTFTVTVNPTPVVTAIGNLVYCGNVAAPAINFSSTTPTTTFAWTSNANAGFGTTGSGNIAAYTTINTPTTNTTASVSVLPTANGCTGTASTFAVTVNPTPTVNPVSNGTFCNGAAGSPIGFSSATAATNFSWNSSVNVGFMSSGTGNIAAYTATNTGATITTANVSVTPTAGACAGPSQTFSVTVNPTPVVNSLGNLVYCGNVGAAPVNFGSPTPTTTFAWTSSGDVGFGTSGSSNIAGYTTTNPVTTTANSTVTITPTANTCVGTSRTFTITVNPTPSVNTVANATYCGNTSATAINFSSNTPNTNFTWTTSANAGFGPNGTGNINAYTTTNPSGVLTSTVSVTPNTNTCAGPTSIFVVTVNPTPAAPGVRTPDVYCQFEAGRPISATANGSNTLSWFDLGTTSFPSAPVPNTNNAGDFSYSVTQTNSFSCVSPRAFITVTTKPEPGIPDIPLNNYVLCQFDAPVQLNATGTFVRWYQPNNTVVSTVPTITTEQGFVGTYGVTQTINGCESKRAPIMVNVRTTPTPGVPKDPIVYCQNAVAKPLEAMGTNVKFYREAVGGEGKASDGPLTQTPGTYDFYATQTGANGCESPRAKIIVAIQPLPTANLSGDATVTQGQSATLKLEFTGQGPWNYTLSNGFAGVAAVGQNPTTVTVSPLETTVYTINRVTNNCGDGTPAGSATINVRTATITTGTPSASTLCANTAFEIPYTSSDFVPANAQYRVQISKTADDAGFQTIPTENANSPLKATVPAATPGGVYFVRVVAVTSFTVRGTLSSVQITVRELPTATISGPTSVFENESAKLSIALTGESPWKVSYKDSLTQTVKELELATSPYEFSVMPGKSNIYSITSIVNACGPGPTTSRLVLRVNPVASVGPTNTNADWLKVYPLPVQNRCVIEVDGVSSKPVSITIVDGMGRVVMDGKYPTTQNEIDLGALAPGVYFLNAEQNGRVANRKILKIQ